MSYTPSKTTKQKGFTQAPPFANISSGDSKTVVEIEVTQKTRSVKSGAGFTLVELLVVISIISLLASIVLASVKVAENRAIDAKNTQSALVLNDAINLFFQDNGYYPTAGLKSSNYLAGETLYWTGSNDPTWQAGLGADLQPYMNELPGQTANPFALLGVNSNNLSYQVTDSTYNNYGNNPADRWCAVVLKPLPGTHFCYCWGKNSYVISAPLNSPSDITANSIDQTGYSNSFLGGNLWYSTAQTSQKWPGPPVVPVACP